jgi:hypothetical protein
MKPNKLSGTLLNTFLLCLFAVWTSFFHLDMLRLRLFLGQWVMVGSWRNGA